MNSGVNIHVSRNSSTNYLRLSKTAEVMSEYIVIAIPGEKLMTSLKLSNYACKILLGEFSMGTYSLITSAVFDKRK